MEVHRTAAWVSFVVSITIVTAALKPGRWCFECASVSNPAECGHVRRCESDQQCFSEKFDTSMGFPKFNSGCEDDKICQRYNKRDYYIHQVGDITICKSCCNNTDGCNAEKCHADRLDKRGTLCFNCMASSSPDECQSVTMCKNHEVCSWSKKQSVFSNNDVYDMGCISESECQQRNDTYCCSDAFCNSLKDFDCQNGMFIPRSKMCDNIDDCPRGLDEKACAVPFVVG